MKAAKAAVPIPTPEGVGTGERGQTLSAKQLAQGKEGIPASDPSSFSSAANHDSEIA